MIHFKSLYPILTDLKTTESVCNAQVPYAFAVYSFPTGRLGSTTGVGTVLCFSNLAADVLCGVSISAAPLPGQLHCRAQK